MRMPPHVSLPYSKLDTNGDRDWLIRVAVLRFGCADETRVIQPRGRGSMRSLNTSNALIPNATIDVTGVRLPTAEIYIIEILDLRQG